MRGKQAKRSNCKNGTRPYKQRTICEQVKRKLAKQDRAWFDGRKHEQYFERGVKKCCLLRKHIYSAKHNVSNILSIALQGETVDENEQQSLQAKQARLCRSTSTSKNPVKKSIGIS